MLRQRLGAAAAGHGGLVFVGGEAGVGKTALLETLAGDASVHGAHVLTGRCYDLTETPPYGMWSDLTSLTRPGGDEARHPLADLVQRDSLHQVTSQAALFERVRNLFDEATRRRLVLLLLDDLHWADPASIELLRIVARQAADRSLLIVAALRGDEVTRRDPLYQLLPVLERETGANRLDLRRLDTESVHGMVASRYSLPGADLSRLVRYLVERAGGNAFYTIQLLRALEDQSVLTSDGSYWRLGDLGSVGVSVSLRQLIDGRVLRLNEPVQDFLTIAAVMGQDVPLEALTSVTEQAEEDLWPSVEAATEARLIETLRDGSGVRFVHALVREAIYEGILPLRRRRFHERVAEALMRSSTPDPDAIAYHLRKAGDVRAAEWLVRAGERAEGAFASMTASERYESAVALLDGTRGDAHRRAWLHLRIGVLRRFRNPYDALEHMETAARLGRESNDRWLEARAILGRGMLRCHAGSMRAGLEDMAAGMRAMDDVSPPEDDQEPADVLFDVLLGRGYYVAQLAWSGRLTEALAEGERLIPELQSPLTGSHRMARAAAALAGLGFAWAMMGDVDRAHWAYETGRAASRLFDLPIAHVLTLREELTFVTVPYLIDDAAERLRMVTESEKMELPGGALDTVGEARYPQLALMIADGRWSEARRVAEATSGTFDIAGPKHARNIALGTLAREQGDAELAWYVVHETWPDGPATPPGDKFVPFAIPVLLLAATLALDEFDLPTARDWLEAHDRWLVWMGAVLGQSESQVTWARFHRLSGDASLARILAETALARATAPRQPLALLAAHRMLGELATGEGRHREAAEHLEQATTLAHACAAPYERALTLLALAELAGATGDSGKAAGLLAEARAICEALDTRLALSRAEVIASGLLPALPKESVSPFSLSPREVEILKLVARGLSNQDIADALFLSVRTVERHVTNAYGKIGVHGRAGATAYVLNHLS